MPKQYLTTLIILMNLLMAACGADSDSTEATPEVTATPLPTPVTVLETTISADGEMVLPLPPQKFGFPSGVDGRVKAIHVALGQVVSAGQLLAEIDDTDLQNAVKRAQANLLVVQAEIDNQAVGPRASELAQAQASLQAARSEFDRVNSLPSEEAITRAAADLRLQEIELRRAQEAYDAIAYADTIALSPQAAELQQATLNHEKAVAAYDEATKPASESDIAAARSRVVEAEAQLDKLRVGLTDEAMILNEAKINQNRLELAEAKANLAKAKIYAPWDGLITEINGAPGVHVSNASVTLVQPEPLRFATENFSERNLPEVNVGDQATLFLKAHPGVPFKAVVQRIAFQSDKRDGDTALFTVYFDVEPDGLTLQPGMTGRVEITLEPEQ